MMVLILRFHFFISKVSRRAPVSVRDLVRQATIHLAGEDETTEPRAEFWITVTLSTLILILTLTLILILILL